MALFDLNAVTLELKAIDSEITRLAKQCCELKKKKYFKLTFSYLSVTLC